MNKKKRCEFISFLEWPSVLKILKYCEVVGASLERKKESDKRFVSPIVA